MTIKLGISACVAGNNVRFDASNKPSNFCLKELGRHVEYQSFCPEVASGMPVPRPAIRQVAQPSYTEHGLIDIRYSSKKVEPEENENLDMALKDYSVNTATKLSHLSGFIFCAKSPSCGMERVKVYNDKGETIAHNGIGVFAREVMAQNPHMPCEENGRLNDPLLKENFVLRVFVYHKWQALCDSGNSVKTLCDFHGANKYLLMSHNYPAYQALGRLLGDNLARVKDGDQAFFDEYIGMLMAGLKSLANKRSHTNTLMHLQGYFKRLLNKTEKQELSETITEYRNGLVPLFVPLTLIKHYLRMHPNDYLASQSYLSPYPEDLKLRYGI